MKWTRIDTLLFVTIAAVSLVLCFSGITFGLPSTVRLEAIFGSRERLEPELQRLEKDIKSDIAYRSESRDRYDPEAYRELAARTAYFDLLRSYNPDGLFTFKVLADMYAKRSVLPYLYVYGPFYFYQIGASVAVGEAVGYVKVLPQREYLRDPDLMARFFICGRLLVALFGVLTALLLYWIGREAHSRFCGFFAALFFIMLPLALGSTKSVKVDMIATFYSVAALALAQHAYRFGRLRDYIWAGAGIALAGATKYTGAGSCLFIVMFHLARKECFYHFRWIEDRKLLAAGLAGVIGFAILTPPLWLDPGRFFSDLTATAGLAEQASWIVKLIGLPQIYASDAFFFTWGPLGALLLSASIIFILLRDRGFFILLLPYVLFFVAILLAAMPNSESYFLPAVPVLSLWCACTLAAIKKRGVRDTLAAAVLFGTLGYSWSFAFPGKDTRLEAIRWINDHIPAGSTLGGYYYPVSYRLPVLDPKRYTQKSWLFDKDDIYHCDYYLDSSFAWERSRFLSDRKNSSPRALLVRHGYEELKTFEDEHRIFGLFPQRRSHRVNYLFETARPRFTVYIKKRK